MTSTLIADPVSRALAHEVAALRADVDQLHRDGRVANLGYSTIEPGKPLLVQNGAGQTVAAIGAGVEAFTIKVMNGTTPTLPNGVTVTSILGGARVASSGSHVGGIPEDYAHSKVYFSAVSGYDASPATYVGQLFGNDSMPVMFAAGTTGYFRVSSVNTSGVEGPASPEIAVQSGQVVAQSVTDGAVGTLAIAAGAVTEAKVAASAITATKVADNAISSPKIIAGGVQTINLAADSVAAGKIAADAITAREIVALTITAAELAANSVTTSKLLAGSVTASKLETDMLLANQRIVVGSLTGGRVQLHHLQGLELYSPGGVRTGWWDPSTGNIWTTGQYSTAGSGTRIVINPGASVPDEIRFYQGNVYAYINAEPAPGGTAAVIGRSQAGPNSRGSFGCYPGEGFVALTNAGGTTSESAFSAIKGAANVWGGKITLEAREAYGDGSFVFGVRNSGGTWVGSREMRLIDQGANNEPSWWGSGQNVKLVFSNGALFVQNNASALAPIWASAFNGASSRAVKKREGTIRLSKASGLRAAFRDSRARSKQWLYEHEREESDPAPTPSPLVTQVPRRHPDGSIAMQKGSVTDPIMDEIVVEPLPGRPVHPHLFPIAEDLMEVLPELVRVDPSVPGGLTIDLRDALGAVIELCREQERALVSLETRVEELRPRNAPTNTLQVPTAEPLGATGSGQFFERGGSLWYMNSNGTTRKVT